MYYLIHLRTFISTILWKTLLGVEQILEKTIWMRNKLFTGYWVKATFDENSWLSFSHVTKSPADFNQNVLVCSELGQHSDCLAPPNILTQWEID